MIEIKSVSHAYNTHNNRKTTSNNCYNLIFNIVDTYVRAMYSKVISINRNHDFNHNLLSLNGDASTNVLAQNTIFI